jgi:hypothetical protein
MARKSKSKGKRSGRMLPVLHPDAAGIDIGQKRSLLPCHRTEQQSRCNRLARSRAIYTR